MASSFEYPSATDENFNGRENGYQSNAYIFNSQSFYPPPPPHAYQHFPPQNDNVTSQHLGTALNTVQNQPYLNYQNFHHPLVNYNHQNVAHQQYYQSQWNINDAPKQVLRDLDANVPISLSRSSSDCSTTYVDLSSPHMSQDKPIALNNRTSDNNCMSRVGSFHSTVPNDVLRMNSDSEKRSHEQNATNIESCVDQEQSKDLSTNYVYQVMRQSIMGRIQLRKQDRLNEIDREKRLEEQEMNAQSSNNITENVDSLDSGGEEEQEDGNTTDSESDGDVESQFDEYTVESREELERDKICLLIINYAIEHHGIEGTKDKLFFIGDELVEVFQFEDKNTWIGINDRGLWRGLLFGLFTRLRDQATEYDMYKNPNSRTRKPKEIVVSRSRFVAYFKDKQEFDDDDALEWQNSTDEKISFFKSSTVPAITSALAILRTPNGWTWLEKDYLAKHDTHDYEYFKKKVSGLSKTIVAIARDKVKKLKNKKESPLKKLLDDKDNVKTLNKDHENNLALLSLAYLCGAVTCKITKGEKNSWKASALQAQQSFVLHVKDADDVEDAQIDMQDLYLKHKLSLHPYVIACGKLQSIEYSYVVLNEYKYKFDGPESLLKAVDVCYKCMSALYKNPSRPSQYTWQFLRKQVYREEVLRPFGPVVKVISNFNNYKLKKSKPKTRKRVQK